MHNAYSFENKKLLKEKREKMDYMRHGERVEVCWEKTVEQERKGEIVGGHKHPAASEHRTKGRYPLPPCAPQSKAKMMKIPPREHVV